MSLSTTLWNMYYERKYQTQYRRGTKSDKCQLSNPNIAMLMTKHGGYIMLRGVSKKTTRSILNNGGPAPETTPYKASRRGSGDPPQKKKKIKKKLQKLKTDKDANDADDVLCQCVLNSVA